jgi:hypothetical protein
MGAPFVCARRLCQTHQGLWHAARRQQRYSPGEAISIEVVPVSGNPGPSRICTSHVGRQNLTLRMSMRRFIRLTNGFSKKFENHRAAIALHFAYYNFCCRHQTPA